MPCNSFALVVTLTTTTTMATATATASPIVVCCVVLFCSAATQHFWISSREECMLLKANDTFEQEREMLLWLSNWLHCMRIQVHQICFSFSRSVRQFQLKCVPLVWTLACAIRAHNCYLRCFTNLNCFGFFFSFVFPSNWTSRLRTFSRKEHTFTLVSIYSTDLSKRKWQTVFGRQFFLRQMCFAHFHAVGVLVVK